MLSHLEVLRQAGFEEVEQYDFPIPHYGRSTAFLTTCTRRRLHQSPGARGVDGMARDG